MKVLKFNAGEDLIIHGFIGYFDGILYDDVHTSINPNNHTKDMLSWYPIYFPIKVFFFIIQLKEPLNALKDDEILIYIWRIMNTQKVWYEWSMGIKRNESYEFYTAIHNVNGRAYWIGLN